MAVSLTDEVKSLIAEMRVGYFATASKNGIPNVSPKGSIRVIDDQTLMFAEIRSPHTRANLLENPNVSVLVFNPANRNGYQIKGTVELVNSGPLWDEVAPPLEKRGYAINYVAKITPQEIRKIQ